MFDNYKLGLDIFGLDDISSELRKMTLTGKIDLKHTVKVDLDKSNPTEAVVFICPLLEAAVTIDVVRSECRRLNDPIVKAYINRGKRWERLRDTDVLTIVNEKFKGVLNPEIFREKEIEEEPTEIIPLAPTKVL